MEVVTVKLQDYSDRLFYPGVERGDDCEMRVKMARLLFPDAIPMRGIVIAYDSEAGYYDAPFDFHWWLWRSADNTVLDSFKSLELALFQNPVCRFDLPPLAQCSIGFLDGKDVRGVSPVELLKSPKTTDLIYIKGLTLAFQPQ